MESKILSSEELKTISDLIEKYRKIYTNASILDGRIESLKLEMVKVNVDLSNVTNEENEFYKVVSKRLGKNIDETRELVLNEIQKSLNT